MNKLFTALLLLFSITGSAQVYNLTDYKFSNRVNIGKGGTTFTPTDGCAMLELGVEGTNKTLLIPRGDTVLIAAAKRGAFHYRIADSSLYFYNALKWSKLATTDLLNGYLKLSDTSSMLMP